MTDPEDLSGFLDLAWRRLDRRPGAGRDPLLMTLATVAPDGWPEARMVVLRGADRAAGRLEIHTDTATAKVTALQADPRAELVFWDAGADLQIRAALRVSILPQAAGRWAQIPESSRMAYGTRPAPGSPIPSAFAYDKTPDPARFAALIGQVEAFDLVHLGPRHRRARFLAADGWRGQWLAP
ncbi:pyridoxamine 5'-phosphate oxidase family protein [Szabonella alba]|uniref:Pyridoxamine 5'-phosphate oxidase family protein n=1 Tax=Szabonella alba TaxID=2804194 RepID=A0A8K0VAP8_9RHOB|nr:pyridoxamine 5'-phosphate oxidase family protein [Szabonella alba]MBL4918744.1 pyridoxamine 5'-phosphate oxidase family protein [Szabonella alba]